MGTELNSLGYSHTVCFRCGVLPTGQSEIFFDKVITVVGDALDCSQSLVDAGFTDPLPIPYNSAGSSVTLAADYRSIFTHS